MNNIFRGLIAGYGAKKLGGGCFGTILVFVLIWVALGQCSFSSREVPPPETYPADRRAHVTLEMDRMFPYTCCLDNMYVPSPTTIFPSSRQEHFVDYKQTSA